MSSIQSQTAADFPDALLAACWLAVATSAELKDTPHAVKVLEQNLVLWRDAHGDARAFHDRCPHRGARLSLGRTSDGLLICPYHGWRFSGDGKCVHRPAHPKDTPPSIAATRAFRVSERYGLVWVCLGEPRLGFPSFPAHGAPGKRSVIDPAVDFAACAPRVVENFLDMAHFPFVHPHTLGEEPHTEVPDYEVIVTPEEIASSGCRFWQPQPSAVAAGGAYADYAYRVTHPTVASLSKLPGRFDSFDILLVTTPIDEFNTRVWKINVFAQTEDETAARFGDFSRAAMMQDRPIVESQSPKRMPLDPRAESHLRADRLSAAYRRWLRDLGLAYGVTR